MATSTLVVYEPLISFGENGDYWKEYSIFYENYWGGPTSPFGVWFGNEYENYRIALSEHLGMEDEDIRDCFFLKKGEDYFVAPLKDSSNVFSFENSIPPEWFILFEEAERKSFYTHWGFNTISYDAALKDSVQRAADAGRVISDSLADDSSAEVAGYLKYFGEGLDSLILWLESFKNGGYIILNYGDICTYIHLLTLSKEKSVDEIKQFINFVYEKEYTNAEKTIRIFGQKWEEIRQNCQGESKKEFIQ